MREKMPDFLETRGPERGDGASSLGPGPSVAMASAGNEAGGAGVKAAGWGGWGRAAVVAHAPV